jgi:hypothetical protein
MFGGSGKKTGFVRTQISLTERLLSFTLLGLIGAVGVAVYLKGQSFDPGLFALDVASLSEGPASRVQAERLIETGDEGVVVGSESALPSIDLLDGLVPDGWRQMGPVETFDADNLYEKINGRAEQYLAYDVLGLTCLSLAESDGQFIDLFVYDMGQPLNAFGIFSVERAPDQPTADLGRESYRAESSFFFWKGQHYVQVLSSDRTEPLRQTAAEVARLLDSRLAGDDGEIWGLALLPEEGRQPGTVQYFKRDALSLDFLANAFTATYVQDGAEMTAFLSQQDSPEGATRTLAAYREYLESYGKIVEQSVKDGNERFIGDLGGFYDVVFQRKDVVAGVVMAEDRQAAQMVAVELLHALESR